MVAAPTARSTVPATTPPTLIVTEAAVSGASRVNRLGVPRLIAMACVVAAKPIGAPSPAVSKA